jgi:hypothetical protein
VDGVTDSVEKDATSDKDLLAQAKEHYKIATDYWADNRKAWLEDMKFAAGDQWPEEIKKLRALPGQERPCLVVDKLSQYRRQVVNDARQNRPSIKVRPVDDGADQDAADGYQGLFRHILNRSNADEAFDTSIDHAATGGFGFFRVLTEYAYEQTFNQEICVKRIRNPLAILLGPHQAADGSDADFGFVEDDLDKKKFKKLYPKARVADWEAEGFKDGWSTDDKVRICEYFYKTEEQQTLHLLEDGTSISDEDYQRAITEGIKPPAIVESREVPLCKVKWCRLSGAEILEKREWLGRYIPIIPVYGNEMDIEGRVIYSGLIRAAKDAQRLYNFSRSAFAERVALAPKAPWIADDDSIVGFEEWETANSGNHQVLRYKSQGEGQQPLPPPQRVSAADVPAGFAQDMQLAEHDIQSALGMYNASLGEKSNEKSGKAIMARQREGDTATFHYQDNQSRAIRYLGRILLDLAPKVYDSKRLIRILGEDGESEAAEVDPAQEVAFQKVGGKAIYNLNVGTYDVEVEAGPSYTTKRQEAAEAQMQLAQAVPQLWQMGGDIIIRNLDWPGASELADRWKLMLPPPILQAEQGQNPMPPEVQQAMQQVQVAQQDLQQKHAQLAQFAQEIQADKAATEAQKVKLEAMLKEIQAADKVLKANYQEYSAKLELEAMRNARALQPQMPPGKDEPAIDPNKPDEPDPMMAAPPQPQPTQPPSGGFFTPGGQ